jgi:DNA-binding NarL/FixJ family response regulator
MIRVVLADDQTLVRQGIRRLLELTPDVRVIAEAEDGERAIALVSEWAPDVMLLDVRMPRLDGLGVLRALAGRLPPTILLTTFDDDTVVLEAVRHGARGFLLKDVSLEQLAEAVRRVAAGGTLILPAISERVLKGLPVVAGSYDRLAPEPLSPREGEVLRLMAGGYSNREIAHALDTAEGTVKNQVSSILAKLGVRDRTRAVLRALEIGFL